VFPFPVGYRCVIRSSLSATCAAECVTWCPYSISVPGTVPKTLMFCRGRCENVLGRDWLLETDLGGQFLVSGFVEHEFSRLS
jgi:hypothetical protein